MSLIITTAELKAAYNCKRTSDLEALLRKSGVRFLYGRGGPITTLDAINLAMGISAGKTEEPEKPPKLDII